MRQLGKNSLLTLAAFICLLALASAEPIDNYHRKNHDHDKDKNDHHEVYPMPEGGSTLTYLLLSGAVGIGVIFAKKRSRKLGS